MSLDALLAKINTKEEQLRKNLEAEYDVIFDKIRLEFKSEIESYRESKAADLKAKIKSLKRKEKTDSDIAKRKAILDLKRQILAEVYNSFKLELEKITDIEYLDWLKVEIAKIKITQAGILLIGFKKVDLEVKCDVIFDPNFGFGFQYKEGSIIINSGIISILDGIKSTKELELAKILF
ncbi:MAG: hypothetical protein GY817_04015 [bacterium]|nr:hypothetical protein [bacterium]